MANPVRAEQNLGITALGREPVDQSKSAVAKAFYRMFMKLTHDQPYLLTFKFVLKKYVLNRRDASRYRDLKTF